MRSRRALLSVLLGASVLWTVAFVGLLTTGAGRHLFWFDFVGAFFAAVCLASGGLFWRDGAIRLGWSLVVFGALFAMLSAVANLSLTIDLYRLHGLHAIAVRRCPSVPPGAEDELVCEAGYDCDEFADFYVHCAGVRNEVTTVTKVFLSTGFDTGWSVDADGALGRR